MSDSILDVIMNELYGKRDNFCRNNDCDPLIRIYVSRKIMHDLLDCTSFYDMQHTGDFQRRLYGYDVIIMENDGYHICVEHPDN